MIIALDMSIKKALKSFGSYGGFVQFCVHLENLVRVYHGAWSLRV
ncbi:hypothetical protein RchiOBHm_Chr5g0066431 [Rosa chinensis]|uniref:Uncharacterized protein n=1 Tax=Rosa chinensis TaxID=74649 RepID=A0A2P6QJ68_ROSCH|nr:hypothetical protein RchiOBHm_Chr5g0066431 [Rosa chinensis]